MKSKSPSPPSRTRAVRWWTWAHRFTATAFLATLVLGRHAWFPWIKGSITSTRLAGVVPFVDPLSGLEVMLASRSATGMMLLGVGATVLIAALLGRVFCGWLCPLGLLLDFGDDLRGRLGSPQSRRKPVLPQFAISGELKYWLLALCLVLSTVTAVPVFTAVSPVNLVALAVVFGAGIEVSLIALLVVLEPFSRRLFCRGVCPLGAFYSLLGKWGVFRIRVRRQSACPRRCRGCSLSCPMGIRVLEDHLLAGKTTVDDPECTRCGACVDRCGDGVLRLGFRVPAQE
jgi:ferredoxin-type protein NapH